MIKHRILPTLAAVFALTLALTGCILPEFLSWSPDGRFLAYASGEVGKFWLWDAHKDTIEPVELRTRIGNTSYIVNQEVVCSRYLPSGGQVVVFAKDKGDNSDNGNIFLVDLEKKDARIVAEAVPQFFDTAADGTFYYLKDDGLHAMLEKNDRLVFASRQNMRFIRLDTAGKRLLYTQDSGLCLLDLDRATSSPLAQREKTNFLWPTWLDERNCLYLKTRGENSDTGDLIALNLDDRTTRSLASQVKVDSPPSLSPDRRRVAVIAQRGRKDLFGAEQVAEVELATGRLTWLTAETLGAKAPAYSPDGRRLAYLETTYGDENHGPILKIIDRKTGQARTIWRNEEERLYAAAEALIRAGEPAQGMAAFQDFLQRHPTTYLKTAVDAQMLSLYLTPPLFDLDRAWEIFKSFGEMNEMPPELATLFWRNEDRIATDPAADWITTYSTPASNQEWKIDTDLTRDLRALWLRTGKEKLYVRVDYGTDKDLNGISFQDTLLLFKMNGSNDTSHTRIGPHVAWEHTADRQVLVRHWFEGGSQYDVEIKNREGEVIHRFLVSGYAPPKDPLFDVMGTVSGENPGVVYAIDRKILGLEGKQPMDVQVCTLKGGIDSRQKLERPVGTGCDIADAFGSENTASRIQADAARTTTTRPCVIQGFAGVFGLE